MNLKERLPTYEKVVCPPCNNKFRSDFHDSNGKNSELLYEHSRCDDIAFGQGQLSAKVIVGAPMILDRFHRYIQ